MVQRQKQLQIRCLFNFKGVQGVTVNLVLGDLVSSSSVAFFL